MRRRQLAGLLFVVGAVLGAQQPPVVDLTTPRPSRTIEQLLQTVSPNALPTVPAAAEYRTLPLELQLESVSPVDSSNRVLVEVWLRNTGSETFYVPISRDRVAFHAGLRAGSVTENPERREFAWLLRLRSGISGEELRTAGPHTYRMSTDPVEALELHPQESALVRFRAILGFSQTEVSLWKERIRRGEVLAAVDARHMAYKNINSTPQNPYFYIHSSDPVLSEFVPLTLEP